MESHSWHKIDRETSTRLCTSEEQSDDDDAKDISLETEENVFNQRGKIYVKKSIISVNTFYLNYFIKHVLQKFLQMVWSLN